MKIWKIPAIASVAGVMAYLSLSGDLAGLLAGGLTRVSIGNATVRAVVADSPRERERGLSGRERLAPDEGMLFAYDTPTRPAVWMKDMRFALDLIWIDENMAVIGVTPDVAPETYPAAFSPSRPVKYFLEVNAGWSRQNGLIGAGR